MKIVFTVMSVNLEQAEECVGQMNSKLDNLGYMTDFFVFSFECKEFIKREPTRKDTFERGFNFA